MEELIYGITIFFVLFFTIRGVRLYGSYKGSIYTALFPGFFEYFYKYEVQRDCSKSSYLKSTIGTQRMLFSIAKNDKGAVTQRFVSIVYNKGVAIVAFLSPNGQLKAKKSDKYWTVTPDKGNEYRILSPEAALNEYRRRVEKLIPDLNVCTYIAVGNQLDLSEIRSDLPVMHYNELVEALKNANEPFISEEMILSEFKKFTQK